MREAIRDGDSTARGGAQLTIELLRNFSGEERRMKDDEPRAEIRRRYAGFNDSTFVKFAHRVFDMLAQQMPFFRRHVAVAAALLEIGRNGGRARGRLAGRRGTPRRAV
ncbi:hypothetical protein, partial [Burkholderia pseudomallei]